MSAEYDEFIGQGQSKSEDTDEYKSFTQGYAKEKQSLGGDLVDQFQSGMISGAADIAEGVDHELGAVIVEPLYAKVIGVRRRPVVHPDYPLV